MIQKKSLKDAIQNPEIISVVGELLPEFSESKSKGLSTLTNGGRITKTITGSTGEKKILILKNFGGGPVVEINIYSGGTVFSGLFYFSSNQIKIAKTSKDGPSTFTFIVKNQNFYVNINSTRETVIIGYKNLFGGNNNVVLDLSQDDLSNPNVTVTV